MSKAGGGAGAKLDVEEYNRALDAITNTAAGLGVSAEEEDGFPAICKLNVGGHEFHCRREHLRSQAGSLLSECRAEYRGDAATDRGHPPPFTPRRRAGRPTDARPLSHATPTRSRRFHGRGGVRV